MSGYNGILSKIGAAASALAGDIMPGAAPLIEAGKSLVAAFENVKAANGGTAPGDAQAAHEALFAKVQAHADSTLGRLEGGG